MTLPTFRTRTLAAVALTLTAGLALSACTGSANPTTTPDANATTAAGEPAASANASFTYAIASDPSSLNPINVGDRWGLTTTNIVYSPLARIESDGSIVNDLADSIEPAADGLSVKVTLKPDLKWSDGEPLTANDVVFTYTNKAIKENGAADGLWIGDQPITATAEDDRTVVFHLPALSAAALNNIAFETYIIPEHVYGAVTDFSGAELDPIAVGSGPYKLVEYKRGEYLRFEANENYHGDAPNIPQLTLQIVPNAETAKTALLTGEIDSTFVTPAQIAEFEGSDVATYPYPEGRVAYLGVIADKIPDVNVRKALFYSLDRTQIADAAFFGPEYYEPALSILPPSNPFATTDLETYEVDTAKATQLLTDAGNTAPTFVLGYSGADPAQTAQATLIQEQAAKSGIKIELQGVDANALFPEIDKGASSTFDLFLGGYIMGTEPDAYKALFSSTGSANRFTYKSAATDQLFLDGDAELDTAARKTIYNKLQQQIADDAVFYPIADNLKILGVNKKFSGVEDAVLVPIYTLENFGKLK